MEKMAGTTMVWQPMTKMTFIGPNSRTPSRRRCLMANPSLVTKMTQKKQMLIVTQMLVALSIHHTSFVYVSLMMALQFATIHAQRNPIGTRATRIDIARRGCRYRRRSVEQTTWTWITSDASIQTTTSVVRTTATMEMAYALHGTDE